MRVFSAACAALSFCVALLPLQSNAALLSALGGAGVYDSGQNITWLADADYIKTSGYDADGLGTLSLAQTFVGYLNSTTYLGFSDWRLPVADASGSGCSDDTAGSTPSADLIGYNCSGGELANLFYDELGGTAGNSLASSGDPDLALFATIPDGNFWTSTENPSNSGEVLTFGTVNGLQNVLSKSFNFGRVWVVRDGGADTVVPVPATAWLLVTGFLAAGRFLRLNPR